jgi:ADP-heptose:LPS heptosyltransferase
LRETGWFDEVCFYTVKPVSVVDRARNVALAMRLRRARFDDIFSLAPPRTTRQLQVDSYIFRGVVGAGRYHAATRAAWPPSVVDPAHREHEGLRLLRIVNPLGTDEAVRNFRLTVPDAELAVGRGLLHQLGVRADQMLVGVGPGSARSATAWPAERFAALGRALLEQFRNVVLIAVGGSSEHRLCDELCAAWGPRSHNLAGRLSVFGTASVLSQCATFIGNDTGPTHLAAIVGIPCVAIYSARNAPGQWQPLGRHHVVLEERPECAGCMLDDCIHEAKKCLTRIETGRVVREAISLIESRRACLVQ